jgi:hypothetical protein
MADTLKWARRYSLELVAETEQLERGVRKVIQTDNKSTVDVSVATLALCRDR